MVGMKIQSDRTTIKVFSLFIYYYFLSKVNTVGLIPCPLADAIHDSHTYLPLTGRADIVWNH